MRAPGGRTQVALTVAVAGSLVLVALLVVVTATGLGPLPLDRRVLDLVRAHRTPSTAALARVVTRLGSSVVTLSVVLVASGVTAARLRLLRLLWVPALVALVGISIRDGVAETVRRPRPPLSDQAGPSSGWSFPSGHSSNALLCWGLASGVLYLGARSSRRRAVHVAVPVVVAGVVGVTRVWLAVHWVSDVVAGWALGLVLLLAALAAVRAAVGSPGDCQQAPSPG